MVTYRTIPVKREEVFATRRPDNKIYLSQAARKALGRPEYISVGIANRGRRFLLKAAAEGDPDARPLYTKGPVAGRFACSEMVVLMPQSERVPLVRKADGLEVRL